MPPAFVARDVISRPAVRRVVAVAAAGATAALGLVAIASPASADATIVVNPASPGWGPGQINPGGAFRFTTAYGAPAGFGDGALELTTNDSGSAKVQYFSVVDAGKLLTSIDAVSYSTFRSSASTGNPIHIPAVNLYLDPDGPAGELTFAPLVFEPYYSYGAPQEDVWQSWDGSGDTQWWSNRAIGSIPANSYLPLSAYQAAAPDATITAYGFNLGSGNPNVIAAADALTIDDKTFDFEPFEGGIVVDDDGFATAGNCNDAATPAFTGVQPAVNAASAGSTVTVCAGDYTGDVTVNKQLTFRGAQAGNDARVGRTNMAAESVIRGSINANGVSGTTIDGFWFTDSTTNVSIALYNGTSGHTVINNVIADNDATAIEAAVIYTADGTLPTLFAQNRVTGGDQHGFFATPEASNVTIRDNAFSGNGSSVVHFAPAVGVSSNVVVTGNTSTNDGNFIVGSGVNGLLVENNTVTDTTGTGMLFGGDFSNVTISHNTISGSPFTGLSISSQFGAANSAFTITENAIVDNARGINFGAGGYTGQAEVHFNRIVGNDNGTDRIGINNTSSGVVDAEDNWFGCNEGPASTECDRDSGPVDSAPHLVLGLTVNPEEVTGTSVVTADLTRNSAGVDRSAAGTVPPTPVDFSSTKGEISQEMTVTVDGKATAQLSRSGATGSGVVSVTADNETVNQTITFTEPSLSVDDVAVGEAGGNAVFTVTLDSQNDEAVTFAYTTRDGSAQAPGDYSETSGVATIPAGQSSITIIVPVVNDSTDETDENFTLRISNASVGIDDNRGTATITDNDSKPSVSVSDSPDVIEGLNATFTLTLSEPSESVTRVTVKTKKGTAKPSDFDSFNQVITFAPGQTTQTVSVGTNLDLTIEGAERFTVKLSKPRGLSIDDKSGRATILPNIT